MTSSWMLVAGALFAAMGVFAKLLAGQFTGAELSLYRSLVGLIAVGAFVIWKRQSLATPFGKGHFWRGLTGTISLIGYFYAMTKLPLATAITLNYTSPACCRESRRASWQVAPASRRRPHRAAAENCRR